MSDKEVSTSRKYSRGPYNKTKSYRPKALESQEPTSLEETTRLHARLVQFRTDINHEFSRSVYRSKVLTNLQGLIDCLTKHIKHQPETMSERILSKLESIENRLTNLEASNSNVSFDVSEFLNGSSL